MGTQMITVVKHGEDESVNAGNGVCPESDGSIETIVKNHSDKAMKRRNKQDYSLDNPQLHVTVPFEHQPTNPMEFVDVPGLKEETEHDVCLAFGCASCIVLCAGDVDSLKVSLETSELRKLPDIYKQVGSVNKPPPILCCVTKGLFQDFERGDYLKLLQKTFGPSCTRIEVMYANCVELKKNGKLNEIPAVIKEFFKNVESFSKPIKHNLRTLLRCGCRKARKSFAVTSGNHHVRNPETTLLSHNKELVEACSQNPLVCKYQEASSTPRFPMKPSDCRHHLHTTQCNLHSQMPNIRHARFLL
jgi:hypothetical protein